MLSWVAEERHSADMEGRSELSDWPVASHFGIVTKLYCYKEENCVPTNFPFVMLLLTILNRAVGYLLHLATLRSNVR